jgi:hypothetical protein
MTFDGAGQIVRSLESVGHFTQFYTDPTFTYTEGDASATYGDRVRDYRRGVLCLDNTFFVLIDQFVLAHEAMWQWHLHAARPITADDLARRALLRYEKAGLDVVFCHRHDLRFRTWEGFDIPPFGYGPEDELPEQAARHHLELYAEMPCKQDALLTVLFPRLMKENAPDIVPLLEGHGVGVRVSHQGKVYRIFMRGMDERIDNDGCTCDGTVAVVFEGDTGLHCALCIGGSQVSIDGSEIRPDKLTCITQG